MRPAEATSEIIFVYAADSGVLNSVLDAVHKIVSPGTYACDLCALTYGAFTQKKEWREYLRELPLPARFLYRDQFEEEFHRGVELPAIFRNGPQGLDLLLGPSALSEIRNVGELIHELRTWFP